MIRSKTEIEIWKQQLEGMTDDSFSKERQALLGRLAVARAALAELQAIEPELPVYDFSGPSALVATLARNPILTKTDFEQKQARQVIENLQKQENTLTVVERWRGMRRSQAAVQKYVADNSSELQRAAAIIEGMAELCEYRIQPPVSFGVAGEIRRAIQRANGKH